MVGAARKAATDADLILVLIDAERGLGSEVERLLAELANLGRGAILVLNKVDKVNKPVLLGLASALNERFTFDATFMISALTGDGIDTLRTYLARHLPEGPWLYPEDQLADMPERLLAAEITREKLFLRLREELPYASTVETEGWIEAPDGSLRVDQVVFVARESQKPIVLGKGGQTIKAIGSAARREMESIFGRHIHLFLFVKVRADWLDDPERYREMGLDFPQEG
jgi:GTP-binding protein Era